MRINDKMHKAQVAIIHVLLFRPHAGFSELQKASKLSSDHFSFHLKKMIEQGLIRKNPNDAYELTTIGKEYANRFDTDAREIERQPKVAVLLLIEREDGRLVCQQRLKQPFYGFWARPTGKVRWGETIMQAAARELVEETGLEADLTLKDVYHKIDFNKDTGDLLEDKIFFTVHGTNPRGDFIETFDGGRNAWFNDEEVKAQEKVFEGVLSSQATIGRRGLQFTERNHYYSAEDY